MPRSFPVNLAEIPHGNRRLNSIISTDKRTIKVLVKVDI